MIIAHRFIGRGYCPLSMRDDVIGRTAETIRARNTIQCSEANRPSLALLLHSDHRHEDLTSRSMPQFSHRRRILHLDGDWQAHAEVKELIDSVAPDCEVITVTGDANAIQLLEDEQFDLVIVDPWATEKAGFEVCGHLLATHPQIPVFFYSRREIMNDHTQAGAPGGHVFFLEHDNKNLLRAVANALE